MSKIKVLVYDVKSNEFYEAEVDEIQDYYQLLESNLIDVVRVSNDINFYVDDEALFKSGNLVSEIKFDDYENYIAGNIIITGGIDEEGINLPCKISIEEAKQIILPTNLFVK